MKWNPKAKRWQLQEAKARFSHLCELALTKGPQRISRRGKDGVVMMREEDYDKAMFARKVPTVMAALMEAANLGALEIPRADEYPEPASGFTHTEARL